MDQQKALNAAIELTQDIFDLIEENDLQSIAAIDKERQQLIRQIFEPALQEIDKIKIRHLNNLNDQVVNNLKALKHKLTEQNDKSRQLGKAAQAYQQNQH